MLSIGNVSKLRDKTKGPATHCRAINISPGVSAQTALDLGPMSSLTSLTAVHLARDWMTSHRHIERRHIAFGGWSALVHLEILTNKYPVRSYKNFSQLLRLPRLRVLHLDSVSPHSESSTSPLFDYLSLRKDMPQADP